MNTKLEKLINKSELVFIYNLYGKGRKYYMIIERTL